jgi:hypothetical protein
MCNFTEFVDWPAFIKITNGISRVTTETKVNLFLSTADSQ